MRRDWKSLLRMVKVSSRCKAGSGNGRPARRQKKMRDIVVIFAVLLTLLGSGSLACRQGSPGEPESIIIGVPPNEQSGLIFIAEDQGFFDKNGLAATVKIYDTALAALDGMQRGEVDVSQSAEFPIVAEALRGRSVSIIASIDRFENIFIAGRKDSGLNTIADLKGKRIGAVPGTLTEFFLARFLSLNGIEPGDVTIVHMGFSESADSLASGTVDAFQVQNKDIPRIREKLGDNLVVWPSQNRQPGFEVISGKTDRVQNNTGTIIKLLKALAEAENYYASQPDKARAIIQRKLNYDDAYMATVAASQHTYSLNLDQSLIIAMEDEARWMMSAGLTAERRVPNFLDYIYEDGLKAVKPEAVNIIR